MRRGDSYGPIIVALLALIVVLLGALIWMTQRPTPAAPPPLAPVAPVSSSPPPVNSSPSSGGWRIAAPPGARVIDQTDVPSEVIFRPDARANPGPMPQGEWLTPHPNVPEQAPSPRVGSDAPSAPPVVVTPPRRAPVPAAPLRTQERPDPAKIARYFNWVTYAEQQRATLIMQVDSQDFNAWLASIQEFKTNILRAKPPVPPFCSQADAYYQAVINLDMQVADIFRNDPGSRSAKRAEYLIRSYQNAVVSRRKQASRAMWYVANRTGTTPPEIPATGLWGPAR